MKMRKSLFVFFALAVVLLPQNLYAAPSLAVSLSGRILLQVEGKGEAWYVNPVDHKRYYLGRPADALKVMRDLGIGISNDNLNKIQVAVASFSGVDSDGDGLSDDLEISLGTNPQKADTDGDSHDDKVEIMAGYSPVGDGKIAYDASFSSRQTGKIFLQVEGKGEAWYVNPVDHKRYYLGRPADAFSVMRSLGLGISDKDLNTIAVGSSSSASPVSDSSSKTGESPLDLALIEQKLHKMVNEQRVANGLSALKWNEELANVAREHSQNQAKENLLLTDFNKICNYAIIHHEGLDFGLMPLDRLTNRGLNYFSRVGENIALIGAVEVNYLVDSLTFNEDEDTKCQADIIEWNDSLEEDMKSLTTEKDKVARLEGELEKRRQALASAESYKVSGVTWYDNDYVSKQAVTGWMDSPGHRANILNSDYDEAGMGVSYVNGYMIATQVFIKRAPCGYTGGPCCERNACYLPSVCGSDQVCR